MRPWDDDTFRDTRGRPEAPRPESAPSYRPWAELLARTFAVDVLACPKCHGGREALITVSFTFEYTDEDDDTYTNSDSYKVKVAP